MSHQNNRLLTKDSIGEQQFEYLSLVNLFLDSPLRYESVDDNFSLLTDSECDETNIMVK